MELQKAKTNFIPTHTLPSLIKTTQTAPFLHRSSLVHSSRRQHWCYSLSRRRRRSSKCCKKEATGSMKKLECENDDDKVEVERKIKALQKLVPGGESLGPEKLFEETADYIVALRGQVNAMKILASFFDDLEKEKTKVGG